jgi:PLP dependent protein
MSIASNLAEIRERMAQAARRAGRDPQEIALMAVSKTQPASAIVEAIGAGQRLFGENRVQEFAAKLAELGGQARAARFHLIGHLQSNKAGRAAEIFDAVESVDSLRLAERLNETVERLNDAAGRGNDAADPSAVASRRLEVLIEINIAEEAAKSGLAPASDELRALVAAQNRLPHLAILGLMCVPPATEEAEGAREYFQQLRRLRDRLRQESGLQLPELSMGMSHDFEVAIEEGATCVRVGTAIFGSRSA